MPVSASLATICPDWTLALESTARSARRSRARCSTGRRIDGGATPGCRPFHGVACDAVMEAAAASPPGRLNPAQGQAAARHLDAVRSTLYGLARPRTPLTRSREA